MRDHVCVHGGEADGNGEHSQISGKDAGREPEKV